MFGTDQLRVSYRFHSTAAVSVGLGTEQTPLWKQTATALPLDTIKRQVSSQLWLPVVFYTSGDTPSATKNRATML